jgi:hypothetical protein
MQLAIAHASPCDHGQPHKQNDYDYQCDKVDVHGVAAIAVCKRNYFSAKPIK